ncbi:MAG: hypothetical protein ABH836_03725 [Candidatus Omnitrophota bacterium]
MFFIAFLSLSFTGIMLWLEVQKKLEFRSVPASAEKFNAKLCKLNWIAYEPVNFNPEKNIYPMESEILRDLEVLRKFNVRGIITFDAKNTLKVIPKLAKSNGFEGVIMGIANPRDERTMELAIKEAEYVDGYCIGHNQLGIEYSLRTLCRAMNYVRKKTNKPVSTTEYLVNYNKIIKYVNWLFPDIGDIWRKTYDGELKTPELLFAKFSKFVRDSDELARDCRKTVLLKMVSFPSEGEYLEFTEKAQYDFLKKVLSFYNKDIEFPRSIGVSFFSAFDIIWKSTQSGWDRAEQHLGIFKRDYSPKQSANLFKEKLNLYKIR